MELPGRAELTDLMVPWTEAAGVVGAAVVLATSDSVTSAAVGRLDVGGDDSVEPTTLFRVGSVTKIITAQMVGAAFAAKGIAIETAASDLLPDLRYGRRGEGRRVTVENLLHHTGGIDGDYWEGFGDGDGALAEYVAHLADLDALFEPGTVWSYSNSGYVVLGRLLEVLRGQDFDHLLADEVRRLGMSSAVVAATGRPTASANGHYGSKDGAQPADTPRGLRALGPAGTTLFADVEDLAVLARALLAGSAEVEPARLVPLPSVGGPNFTHQGPGWKAAAWPDLRVIGHDGSASGQASFLRTYPDHGLTVALLVNTVPNGLFLAHRLLGWVHDHLLGIAPPEPLAPPAEPPAFLPGRYEGTYTRRDAVVVIRDSGDGGLALESGSPGAPPSIAARLTALDQDRFIADRLFADTTGIVTFESAGGDVADILHAGPFTATRR